MKYENEFNELASLFYEDWMDKKNRKEFKQVLLKVFGPDYFDSLVQKGVDDGYGAQVQMEILRRILKKELENEC